MIEILYCFDKNYNDQALVSIYSLLKNCTNNLSINILHDEPETFLSHCKVLEKKLNFTNFKFYKFKESNYNFPKVFGTHISKATYYRLFISNYLDSNLKNILYLDPDVVCLNKFEALSDEVFKKLTEFNLPIGVRTEHFVNTANFDRYKSIEVTKTYFNAGVMFINFENWLEKNYLKQLINVSRKIEDNIIFWDQDVLNSFFNSNYLEIPNQLNQHPFNFKNSYDFYLNNTVFLHFSGKDKPWTKKGKRLKNSKIYLDLYKEVFGYKLKSFK